jgi:hypothetical protein
MSGKLDFQIAETRCRRASRLLVHDHEVRVDGFDPDRYAGGELELESKSEVTRLKLSGEDTPLRGAAAV